MLNNDIKLHDTLKDFTETVVEEVSETVNDNVEPGTHLQFRCVDDTNWVVSGVVLSADVDPAFS